MAMVNFAIKSDIDAKNWVKDIERLNQETSNLIKEVGKALVDVNQGCDADIVDDIAKYGNQILESSTKILEGMSQISEGILSVLQKADEAIGAAKDLLKGAVKSIASHLG